MPIEPVFRSVAEFADGLELGLIDDDISTPRTEQAVASSRIILDPVTVDGTLVVARRTEQDRLRPTAYSVGGGGVLQGHICGE